MGSSDWARLSQLTGENIREFGDVINLDADVIGKVLQDEKFVSVLTAVNSEFVTYIQNIEYVIGGDSYFDGLVITEANYARVARAVKGLDELESEMVIHFLKSF
jgi:ribosome-interacting GTPase 1